MSYFSGSSSCLSFTSFLLLHFVFSFLFCYFLASFCYIVAVLLFSYFSFTFLVRFLHFPECFFGITYMKHICLFGSFSLTKLQFVLSFSTFSSSVLCSFHFLVSVFTSFFFVTAFIHIILISFLCYISFTFLSVTFLLLLIFLSFSLDFSF